MKGRGNWVPPPLFSAPNPPPLAQLRGVGALSQQRGAQAPSSLFKEEEAAQTPLLPASTFCPQSLSLIPFDKGPHSGNSSTVAWKRLENKKREQRRGKGLSLRSLWGELS